MSGAIRPVERDDLARVVELYQRAMRSDLHRAPPGLAPYFERTLLDQPWADPEIPSLLAAKKGAIGSVLDCLFADAWQKGATALEGRLEPALYEPLSQRRCLLRYGTRALFHSRDPEVEAAMALGESALTRLDGEWWMAITLSHSPERIAEPIQREAGSRRVASVAVAGVKGLPGVAVGPSRKARRASRCRALSAPASAPPP